MSDAVNQIDSSFFSLLASWGFQRFCEEVLSYEKTCVDRSARLHVDVELREASKGFGVTLQEVGVAGTVRRTTLEEFSGRLAYTIDSLNDAIDDMAHYGIPWLEGCSVETDSTARVRQLVAEKAYRELVASGRAFFRNGEFEESVRKFVDAGKVKQLEPTDEKFLAVAQKRIASRGSE